MLTALDNNRLRRVGPAGRPKASDGNCLTRPDGRSPMAPVTRRADAPLPVPTASRPRASGPPGTTTADELVRAVTARIVAVGDGGSLGVVFSGDESSQVLLGLTVRALGRSRVVALVDPPAAASPVRRCAVVQAANGLGAPAFDLGGRAAGEVVGALGLSAAVVPEGARGGGEPPVVVPLALAGLDLVAAGISGPPPDRSRADEDAVQVEAAESELRRLGLEELRVRHHGELARIEAPYADVAAVAAEPLRGEVLRAVRSAGFRRVALDLGALADAPEA